MIWIKYRFPLLILVVLVFLLLCSCSIRDDSNLSEVDLKNDLSVQILYRQISYSGILSFKNGTLYLTFSQGGEFPDGLNYEVNSSEITSSYCGMEKSMDFASFPETFTPKILFSFFSGFTDKLTTEESKQGEYSCLKRTVYESTVEFRVNEPSSEYPYTIVIT